MVINAERFFTLATDDFHDERCSLTHAGTCSTKNLDAVTALGIQAISYDAPKDTTSSWEAQVAAPS
jgi:hypothetical protein